MAMSTYNGMGAKQPLTPRDKANVDSELTPHDLNVCPGEPTDEDVALIKLVDDRFQQAADNRRMHEGQMVRKLRLL